MPSYAMNHLHALYLGFNQPFQFPSIFIRFLGHMKKTYLHSTILETSWNHHPCTYSYMFMFYHFLERNVLQWDPMKFHANPCNQETKLHHIVRANLTLKFPRSPRTLANDRLWTEAHAGPYKLQGGADSAIPSGNNLSTAYQCAPWITMANVLSFFRKV